MMLLLVLIGGMVMFVLVIDLRRRVEILEQNLKAGISKNVSEIGGKGHFQTNENQQSIDWKPLIDYVAYHLEQGTNRESIEKTLFDNGWQTSDIEKAFVIAGAKGQKEILIDGQKQAKSMMSEKIAEWLKEDWLLKLGALLLIIGFGWLTTYAFLNNWIGPMGRIALGIIAGALFILLGWWRIKNYLNQGGVFLILGSTTILLTIFAARTVYNFFTPLSALIVMFLSTVFVALASVKYNSRALSILSLVFAGIAPLLTKSPATDHIALFTYLLIVIFGAIWVVVLTGQRELIVASLLIVSAYSLPHLFSPSSFPLADVQRLLLFAYIFATLFFLTSIVGILRLKNKKIAPDLIIALGNGLFLLTWIAIAAQDEWKSLIIASWMIVFGVGAFLVFKITQRKEPFYVYIGVSLAMLAAATSAELNGAILTIAYTVEAGVISLVAYFILKNVKIAAKISLLLIGPIFLSFSSVVSSVWLKSVINKDFFVILTLGLTMFGLGIFFLRYAKETEKKELRQISAFLSIGGSVYLYILIWLSLHAGLQDNNVAVMISLVIYTIIGILIYFHGLTNEKKGSRLYGGALVGFVVGRLLIIDVWKMELAGRTITFFLIGALLVSTAFLGRRKNNKNILNNK